MQYDVDEYIPVHNNDETYGVRPGSMLCGPALTLVLVDREITENDKIEVSTAHPYAWRGSLSVFAEPVVCRENFVIRRADTAMIVSDVLAEAHAKRDAGQGHFAEEFQSHRV